MPKMHDVKGVEVHIDSLVQGFTGSTRRVATGRVVARHPEWGWIVAHDPEGIEHAGGRQHVFYEGRYLVRDEPRPVRQRTDIPERLVHL